MNKTKLRGKGDESASGGCSDIQILEESPHVAKCTKQLNIISPLPQRLIMKQWNERCDGFARIIWSLELVTEE